MTLSSPSSQVDEFHQSGSKKKDLKNRQVNAFLVFFYTGLDIQPFGQNPAF
jgi:hypothetical protein